MKNRLFFSFVASAMFLTATGLTPLQQLSEAQANNFKIGTIKAPETAPAPTPELKLAPLNIDDGGTTGDSINDSGINDLVAPEPIVEPAPDGDNAVTDFKVTTIPTAGNSSECSDGMDNDIDGDIDVKDSGCHDDFDANNQASYDPNLDNEGGGQGGGIGCWNGDTGDELYDDDYSGDGQISPFDCPDLNLTIEVPKNAAILEKEDAFTISGKCDVGSHVFIKQNSQKNPAYALCSNQGAYKTGSLNWLASVKKGTKQNILAYEVNSNGFISIPVKIGVIINQTLSIAPNPACSDGVDNDKDGVKDEKDPGCWLDPGDPGTYDPKDPDEGGGLACDDSKDNDNDGVMDEKDPGCHTDGDPDNEDSYDPKDPNEANVMVLVSCIDGKDNDGDGKNDSKDPGCHTDGNPENPDSYQPSDPDETDKPSCNDEIDNDNDGFMDKDDHGCWTDPTDPGTFDPTDPDEGGELACSDGKDNDNDGVKDEKDPGCHTDGNPDNEDSYDPNDNDEGGELACADNKDNDNDGKLDKKDSGCHTDGNPENEDSYDPSDNDESTSICNDLIDNDNDGDVDGRDPGCWKNPKDPTTYDKNDPNEGDEPMCGDGNDNDGDGKVDEKDPGCHNDSNPNNPDSYNPWDNDEKDPTNGGGNDNPNQTDGGSIIYNPGKDYVKEANAMCLKHNPQRLLTFSDVKNLKEVGALAAITLKNTYLKIDTNTSQYLLSGYGSDLLTTGKSVVGLNNRMNRLELAKIMMLAHCLPIMAESSLPNVRYNGEAMVSYRDLPRSNGTESTFAQSVAYSAQYYNIMRGTDERNFEAYRGITIEELFKPVTRVQEFRTGTQSARNDAAVTPVSNRWSYEFYSKAAQQGLLKYIPNAVLRPTDNVIRKNAFELMINAMLNRDLYSEADETTIRAILTK